MPWMPEVFTAPIAEALRAHEAASANDAVPYYGGIMAEEPGALIRSFAGSRRVTDAKLCQDLAYLFEEAEGQDRYPLRVDHLQGYGYFGCDLLSFDTPEQRDRFDSAPDERLVGRFIEVKGRGSEKGSIWLEGNELDSARKYNDRYYMYRLYQKTVWQFEVAVLNDPLSSSPKPAYEVDLFRSTRTTRYEVDTTPE